MSAEEELRRLFAEDRGLDLPVAADASGAVLRAVRRRRRRRRVVVGTGAAVLAAVLGGGVALTGVAAPAVTLPPATLKLVITTPSSAPAGTTTPSTRPRINYPEMKVVTDPRQQLPTSDTVTVPVDPPPPRPADPPADPSPIGPTGYRGLTLGMTAEQAEATGLLVPNAQPVSAAGCRGYDYVGAANPASHYSVLISDTYGLIRVAGRADAVTPEHIYPGSTEQQLHDAYPDQVGGHGAVGEWVAAVPGNPAAHYWIIVRDQRVSEIRLEAATQDCYR